MFRKSILIAFLFLAPLLYSNLIFAEQLTIPECSSKSCPNCCALSVSQTSITTGSTVTFSINNCFFGDNKDIEILAVDNNNEIVSHIGGVSNKRAEAVTFSLAIDLPPGSYFLTAKINSQNRKTCRSNLVPITVNFPPICACGQESCCVLGVPQDTVEQGGDLEFSINNCFPEEIRVLIILSQNGVMVDSSKLLRARAPFTGNYSFVFKLGNTVPAGNSSIQAIIFRPNNSTCSTNSVPIRVITPKPCGECHGQKCCKLVSKNEVKQGHDLKVAIKNCFPHEKIKVLITLSQDETPVASSRFSVDHPLDGDYIFDFKIGKDIPVGFYFIRATIFKPDGSACSTNSRLIEVIDPPTILPTPPIHLRGRQRIHQNSSSSGKEIVNVITWEAPHDNPLPVLYRIFRDANLTKLLASIPATDKLKFIDRHRKSHKSYKYFIVSVDEFGLTSKPAKVTIHPKN